MSREKKLTTLERRNLKVEISKLLGKNKSDSEICEALGIRSDLYSSLKVDLYSQARADLDNVDKYIIYSNYCMQQDQNIKELDEIRKKFKNRGQWTALVAAIKQKSDILDKKIKLGQEFGFIEKQASEINIKNEVSFGSMSDEDLNNEIKKEVKSMLHLSSGNVINMRPELLGITDAEISSYIPDDLLNSDLAKEIKKNSSTKISVTLKKKF